MSQLTDNLSAIASIKSDIAAAIESKGVSMSGVSFGSYADKIGEIQTGGGYTEKDITEGHLDVSIVNLNNSASFVAAKTFSSNSYLQTVNLSVCYEVGSYAFNSCINLSYVSIPNCKIIYNNAFESCTSITSLNFDICEFVGSYAFNSCVNLSYISIPNCRMLKTSVLDGCPLSELYLPTCSIVNTIKNNSITKISVGAVYSFEDTKVLMNCSNLSQLYVATSVYNITNFNWLIGTGQTSLQKGIGSIYIHWQNIADYYTAAGWSSLSSLFVSYGDPSEPIYSLDVSGRFYGVVCYLLNRSYYFPKIGANIQSVRIAEFPNCVDVSYNDFYGYTNLSKGIFPNCTHIGSQAFIATGLKELYLGGSIICKLDSSQAFNNVNTISIFVPSSLVEAYKSANNWSNISSRIFPIPE